MHVAQPAFYRLYCDLVRRFDWFTVEPMGGTPVTDFLADGRRMLYTVQFILSVQ